MSEPNDTAQEGFDQLKRNLEVRYPEDSDLSLDEFLNVESLLALAVRVCGPGADPRKADRLLSNYQLIRPETIGADGHLMQMARRHLFSLASSTAWRRLLGLYERAEYERYRFFDIANGGMALREHPLTGIDRMPIYIDRLLGDVKLSHKNVVARPKGRYSYTCKPEATGDTTVTGSIRWVTIPDAVPPQTGKIDDIPRKSRRPPIDITLDELISTADEVGEKTGKTHYAAVLRRVKDQGLLKRARGGSTSVADGLRLDEVVSLVGLVGAGKSVLANMLIVCLAKRGLRAVSLLNSVSDVMESVVLLREAGISASPLVSRGRRIERLDEFFDHDDSMLLGHSASKYLETACIMDGLSSSDPEACGYGSTPCRGLRSKKGGANSCPYWDVCPSQAMARESLTSDVVVTTPTGFATMIVGRERKAFFEEALQQFDVVLFDEADRVQAQLDGCFAPSMSFQELIRNAADPTAVAMKRRPDDKMRDFNEELFYDLRQKSEPVAKALLKSVRDDRVAKWRIVKDEAFTSLSLLNDLLEQGLPKQVYEDADKLINPYRFEIAKKSLDGGGAALNKLSQAVATSCEGIDDDTHSYSLNEYLAACGCSELPDELRTRFSFALKVIRFDSYLRELASAQDLLSFKDDSVDELYNFLKFSYTRQQHYLPNSLIGNIFGMKLDGNDLRLFRQFAFGRAFMCSLPWLDTDPVSARARQEAWGRANRARLARCTGRDRAVFQLIGNQDDARLLDMARAEISRFLGGEGAVDGFEVEIDNIPANDLLNRMENTGDSQAKIRWRKVAAALPEATDPTACIVVLPGAESYKPKGKDDGGDPKRALRIAFAKTGRLTQFIEPEDSKDSPEIRARVAVRDLMRQLGFVPEPARNSRGIDTSIPAIGLKVYNSGNGKARASFPYCVRQDMRSGAVTVYCPLLPDGSLPYWRALIEFARLSGSEGFPDSCKRANGMALKRMLHGIVRATGDRPELLLVNSYGRIRQRDWWPGISDSGLESGPLSYGPTGYEEPLGLAGSKLRILRIRSGLNGEVPDWFTDEVAAGGADDGTVPNRRDKQGLFKMDGYFLALAPRPGDAQYKWSARGSKYDSPTAAFCEKTINEYCLLSPGGEAEALASVKYAEALRGCMVQLYKNDMRVNLPAPLHLAEQVEEYIWDWELTGRR